ncbi:MAG: hypothetical protein PHV68_04490 [Candidatus Gastranaerophilales bacterium]|nr:hypothetical protein [Candidatus Gastranaerophilales bacterium]
MSLGINNFNNVSYKNAFVSGAELEQVSQQLFAAASSTKTSSVKSFPSVSAQNANLGLINADIQTIRQIAANKAGLDVNLSTNALSTIEMLKSQAAQNLFSSVVKTVDGKLHVPNEMAEKVNLKEVFSVKTKPELFNIADMDKDRKGSNPFVFVASGKEEKTEEIESLNIFA